MADAQERAGAADEAALVAGVAAADQGAYRRLMAAHLPAVNRYAQRMLLDPDEADDVTQEVFLRLWTEAARYRPQAARLSTWLHRIAHNLCIDRLRRRTCELPVGDAAEPGAGAEASAPPTAAVEDAVPDVSLARRRDIDVLRRALAALPERQRSALLLTHYQELPNRDVAVILELSVDALESLLARARRSMRRQLEAEYGS
jgi:RNA polymerase sigma-70 factor (ECF subfamily)